ncbi:EboA domain-containing protein [Sphingobacterium daejeonense]|uniref:EboA domain-containing protein n=1 Tax=Sphingobacterium daejeonense TaxID=371142 RepID=UPI0010C29BFC|nr:EboA domain-containing protein [Sphingobacterium daejeonense]VTP90775.1 Uncharacterised protein [Sphingobacterium daejeonense]
MSVVRKVSVTILVRFKKPLWSVINILLFTWRKEAWNQLVLKSFFTGKEIKEIYGLYDRNNENLSNSIVDYIYERDSAKREINPMLMGTGKGSPTTSSCRDLKTAKQD